MHRVKLSDVSLADIIIACQALKAVDINDTVLISNTLGFDLTDPSIKFNKHQNDLEAESKPNDFLKTAPRDSTEKVTTGSRENDFSGKKEGDFFVSLQERSNNDSVILKRLTNTIPPALENYQSIKYYNPEPLFKEGQVRSLLIDTIAEQGQGNELDIKQLISDISHLRKFSLLPKKRKKVLPSDVTFQILKSRSLSYYYSDLNDLVAGLNAILIKAGPGQFNEVTEKDLLEKRQLSELQPSFPENWKLDFRKTIILITDLGYSYDSRFNAIGEEKWLHFLSLAKDMSVRIIALTPFKISGLPPWVKNNFEIITWDRSDKYLPMAEETLTLIASCLSVFANPNLGILRSICKKILPETGPAIEWTFLNSRFVSSFNGSVITLNLNEQLKLREDLAKQDFQKSFVLKMRESIRLNPRFKAFDLIAFEEDLISCSLYGQDIAKEKIVDKLDKILALVKNDKESGQTDQLLIWINYLLSRMPEWIRGLEPSKFLVFIHNIRLGINLEATLESLSISFGKNGQNLSWALPDETNVSLKETDGNIIFSDPPEPGYPIISVPATYIKVIFLKEENQPEIKVLLKKGSSYNYQFSSGRIEIKTLAGKEYMAGYKAKEIYHRKTKTYRIFLSSSDELKADREQFEIFIARQNRLLRDKNVYLELVLWENIGDEVHPTRMQDIYNEELKTCDIFVMLYWTKIGMYANEEFDVALDQFRTTKNHPRIYVFEKTQRPPSSISKIDEKSLQVFKEKMKSIGHFVTQYDDHNGLVREFKKNLDRLFAEGYLTEGSNKHKNPAQCLYTDGNSVPVDFIGRESELREIKEKLNKGGMLMLINAEGGTGKTSLAAKYWEESLYDYKYNAWLFCEAGIMPSLKKLAPALGIDLNGLNEAKQTAALKQALAKMATDTLLVLDNADTVADIKEFIKIFWGLGLHVLITSRRNAVLDKEQELYIDHLPPDLAKELFKRNHSESTPEFDALLERFLAAIGYHTLLTELFSKNLAKLKDTGETLEKFLNKLETVGLFLKERSFEIPTDYTLNRHADATDTDSIIEILYDFKDLQEDERYCLVNIALLPAVNYDLTFLAQLFNPIEIIDFQKVLQSIYQKGWLGYAEGSYRISPVIQRLVLQKNGHSLQKDSKILIDNLIEKLDNDGTYLINLGYAEAARFAGLVPSLTNNLTDNIFKSLGWLNERTSVYFLAIGDLVKAQKAAQKYHEICLATEDNLELANSYFRLGYIFSQTGEFEKTLDYYKKANEVNSQLYKKNPGDINLKNSFASSIRSLGKVYNYLGDFEKALDFYQQDNGLIEQLYNMQPNNVNFKNGLAYSYGNTGNVYNALGDFTKALVFFQKACMINTELYHEYPSNVKFKNELAYSYGQLGNTYSALGDFEQALNFYHKDIELARQLNHEHPSNVNFKNGLAYSLNRLGFIHQQKQDVKLAKLYYNEALYLFEELVAISPQMNSFKKSLTELKQTLKEL